MPTSKTPRKTTKAKPTDGQDDKEQVTLWFAKATARRLRAQAVEEGKRYSVLAEELVSEGLDRRRR